jgi:ketosteroid isomerase-like protein
MSAISPLAPVDRVRRLFAAIDTLEPAAPLEHVADEIVFRFGNADPVVGKRDFADAGVQFFGSLAAIRHDMLSIWEPEDDVVVTEMDVTYGRHDGSTVKLPCCNVFRLRDGLIATYTIYMDIGPVFA